MGGCQETGTEVGGGESIKDGDEIIWILFGGGYMTLWASLVAQSVKYPPAMQETWVQSLGWEDLLEEGMATHSSILAWRIPMDRGAWLATVHRVAESQTWLSDYAQHSIWFYMRNQVALDYTTFSQDTGMYVKTGKNRTRSVV